MKSSKLKTSGYYWIALVVFLIEAVLEIDSIGTEITRTRTPAFTILSIALLAGYSWLCFRAGQESKS